ncbi:MFS transporter [Streptomyces sp. NBC_01693]|uniref:MFS transporter n=1 Tax=unclassified Streptomyces TaxID=2593676 RepID=UPI002E33D415|nr:MFS transporter [Streptomyces sp. NBC_01693]
MSATESPSTESTPPASGLSSGESSTKALYSRIGWRLIPLLFAGYVLAYLDRINIGFAQLQMKDELGFSAAVYGLGAGLYFATYFVFEVPSNLLMKRIGARLTLSRIMILWGVVSIGMLFVQTPTQFYVMRLLLGAFEAGYAPGVMLLLTYWFPDDRRARVMALFLCGSPIAGALGSPVSGWILQGMDEVAGMGGWQWLFLIEGLPSVALGVIFFLVLPDAPAKAKWLTADEQRRVTRDLNHDRTPGAASQGFANALRDINVYVIALAWFTVVCGIQAVSFWMPLMLKDAGVGTPAEIGAWASIPFAGATIMMLLLSRHSDTTGERRWHIAIPCMTGAAALVLLSFAGADLALSLVSLTFLACSVYGAMPILLSVPVQYLAPGARAGGIALINSIGLSGGFVSPFILGWVKTQTGSVNNGLYCMAGLLVIGSVLVLTVIPTGPRAVPSHGQ